jgi:GNAT superfamily N-acetyltransferase
MSPVTVRPVRTRADTGVFIRVQWAMNAHLVNWVPPLISERRALLDRTKNPFFLHSEAEYFIAERDGAPVGRIAAILNNNHNREHGENIGFFGFFESADDPAVASALFAAAEEWLRGKKVDAVRGPANPSVNDEYGLLVEGFDDTPTVMMPFNPPCYGSLIEGAGYARAKDLYAYGLHSDSFVSEKLARVTARLMEREGLTIRTLNMGDFPAEIERIRALYAGAWQYNWGAVPLTREEFDALAKSLRPVLRPDLVLFAEAAGEPVGFALTLPDYNQVLRFNRSGRLVPAILRLIFMRKKIRRVRILVLGVLPDRLRTGAGSLLMYETGRRAVAMGYPEGEAGWVLEDNVMMNRAAAFMNGTRTKVYRVYQKSL